MRGSLQVKALRAVDEQGVGLELAPLLEELRDTLRAHNVIAYRPEYTARGWDLEYSFWVGPDAAERSAAHRRFVQGSEADEPTFAAYDPFLVQRDQQNVALDNHSLFALEDAASSRHQQLYAALRSRETEQIRILLCDGPRLLMWIGALREEPFQESEVALLQSLAGPLRDQLRVHRQLSAVYDRAPLVEHVLEALDQPAVILSSVGNVEFLNGGARQLLDHTTGRALFAALRRCVIEARPHPNFVLTPLPDCPGYVLALHTRGEQLLSLAIARACQRWNLNARHATFLEHVARGMSNKEIASLVGCAEVTVEKQITLLLRSSGARSRTDLMARLYAL